jgi:O-antigen ligase/polysaccharide polymerase Wzy-like membrane protein
MILGFLVFLIVYTVYPVIDLRNQFENFYGLIFLSTYLAFSLRKIHWSVAVAFLVCALSSIVFHFNPHGVINRLAFHGIVPDMWKLGINDDLMTALSMLLLFAWFGTKIDEEDHRLLKGFLYFGAILNALWIIGKTIFFGKEWAFSLFSNSAIDASFISCILPVFYAPALDSRLVKYDRFFHIGVVTILLTAIFLTRSSTGYAGVGIAIASYLVFKYRTKGMLWALGLAPIISLVSWLILDKELLNPNGRFHTWKISYDFIIQEANKWIGTGFGTFYFWGPQIQLHQQLQDNPHFQGKIDLFAWMHNDWLQVFFELGVVGSMTVGIMYFCMLRAAWKAQSIYFCVLVTYGFIAITQMPLRLFVFQMLGVVIIREVFSVKGKAPSLELWGNSSRTAL